MTAVCNRRMRSSCYCSDFVIETVTRHFQKIQSFAKRCRSTDGGLHRSAAGPFSVACACMRIGRACNGPATTL